MSEELKPVIGEVEEYRDPDPVRAAMEEEVRRIKEENENLRRELENHRSDIAVLKEALVRKSLKELGLLGD